MLLPVVQMYFTLSVYLVCRMLNLVFFDIIGKEPDGVVVIWPDLCDCRILSFRIKYLSLPRF